jgi:hypothetical protein
MGSMIPHAASFGMDVFYGEMMHIRAISDELSQNAVNSNKRGNLFIQPLKAVDRAISSMRSDFRSKMPAASWISRRVAISSQFGRCLRIQGSSSCSAGEYGYNASD